MQDPFLDLFSIIEDRKKSKSKKSYTLSLFKEGEKKIAQKFGEESAELIIDYLKGTKKRTIEEATDLIYHLFVLLWPASYYYFLLWMLLEILNIA